MNYLSPNQKISAIILGGLLLAKGINAFSIFAARSILFPFSTIDFVSVNVFFYTALGLLTFPLLSLILKINDGEIAELGIDQYYMLIFAITGIFGLYYLPYTIFSTIALPYALPLLFEKKINLISVNKIVWGIASILSILFGGLVVVWLHSTNQIEIYPNLVHFLNQINWIKRYYSCLYQFAMRKLCQ